MNTCSIVINMKPYRRSIANSSNEDGVVQLADLFRLMGDPTRLRIVLATGQAGPMGQPGRFAMPLQQSVYDRAVDDDSARSVR